MCSFLTLIFCIIFIFEYPRVWTENVWNYFRDYYAVTCFLFFWLSVALLVAICKLLRKIKKFFIAEMHNEANTLRKVFIVFTGAYLVRSSYLFFEAYISISSKKKEEFSKLKNFYFEYYLLVGLLNIVWDILPISVILSMQHANFKRVANIETTQSEHTV